MKTKSGVEIKIDNVEVQAFENARNKEVIIIKWSSNIGFGEYTLVKDESGKWKADSECMDNNEHKDFLKLLLDKFMEDITIE